MTLAFITGYVLKEVIVWICVETHIADKRRSGEVHGGSVKQYSVQLYSVLLTVY